MNERTKEDYEELMSLIDAQEKDDGEEIEVYKDDGIFRFEYAHESLTEPNTRFKRRGTDA